MLFKITSIERVEGKSHKHITVTCISGPSTGYEFVLPEGMPAICTPDGRVHGYREDQVFDIVFTPMKSAATQYVPDVPTSR